MHFAKLASTLLRCRGAIRAKHLPGRAPFRLLPAWIGTRRSLSLTNGRSFSFTVSQEVQSAVDQNKPIVALESTIISHGMPYPKNYETAVEVESIVRENGAVPATIAILNGKIHVGLDESQLRLLAEEGSSGAVKKCSRRDISYVVAKAEHGATTVAGTLTIADAFGHIDVFVTGGIGGVHRGDDLDVSADLLELGRSNIMVVCAGVKSILDIARTLEYLETQGVAVIGYDTDEFPSFFTRKSGLKVPMRLNTVDECAHWVETNKLLNLSSGAILAIPNPCPFANETAIDSSVNKAIKELEDIKSNDPTFTGKDATPFLLRRVNELTGGDSLKSNIALVKNNALVGSKIAAATKRAIPNFSSQRKFCTSTRVGRRNSGRSGVYVFGGSTIDLVGRPSVNSTSMANTSTPGIVKTSFGGVARNIVEAMGRCSFNHKDGVPCRHLKFISCVGNDQYGNSIIAELNKLGIDTDDVHISEETGTATYQAILDSEGDLYCAIADMHALTHVNTDLIESSFANMQTSGLPSLVVVDGNLSYDVFSHLCRRCKEFAIPLWFEPTSVEKSKLVKPDTVGYLHFLSPNEIELQSIHAQLFGSSHSRVLTLEAMAFDVLKLMHVRSQILVTLGKSGACIASLDDSNKLKMKYLRPEKVDTHMVNATGAGDTLVGATVAAMLEKQDKNGCKKHNSLGIDSGSLTYGMKAASLSIQCDEPVSTSLNKLGKAQSL